MSDYRDSKWAYQLVGSQQNDGKWGYFHSLSNPSRENNITTEQALRRLEILGFTEKDKVIQKALEYMSNCLVGKDKIPDRVEKCHNWNAFTELMLATWICRFTNNNEKANSVSRKWNNIIEASFSNGEFSFTEYKQSFLRYFNDSPRGGRFIDPVNFYVVSIVSKQITRDFELSYLRYVMNYETGIYYVYDKPLTSFPLEFESKESSKFISAFELLSKYYNSRTSSLFNDFITWLYQNRNDEGKWNMGIKAKDGLYFPLSDSWRKIENRVLDSTNRIENLLNAFK